jgi:ketosteroid isomerase-like protein
MVLFLGKGPLFGQPATPDTADVRAITEAAESFSGAYIRGDVEAMMNWYAEDAVILPGGTDIIRGYDAIRTYWTLPPGRKVTHHRSASEEVRIVGNTAYDYGYYAGAMSRDGGEPVRFSGKYTIVWEKGKDGIWRMKVDMWNTRGKDEGTKEE